MRLKATAQGVDLTLFGAYEEQDLLRHMLKMHYYDLNKAILHTPNLTKDNVHSVTEDLEKSCTPWVAEQKAAKRDKERRAMEDLFDNTAFVYDRDIRTDQPFIRMEKKHATKIKSR